MAATVIFLRRRPIIFFAIGRHLPCLATGFAVGFAAGLAILAAGFAVGLGVVFFIFRNPLLFSIRLKDRPAQNKCWRYV